MTAIITGRTVTRIISGGQTGADRGALNAAIALKLEHGGWCPAGRRAEDGTVPAIYQLREAPSTEYPVRTRLNVRDSDGTLIFTPGAFFTPGSRQTLRAILEYRKPHHHLNMQLKDETIVRAIRRWLAECAELGSPIRILNIAGSRESKAPGIARHVERVLTTVLRPPVGLFR